MSSTVSTVKPHVVSCDRDLPRPQIDDSEKEVQAYIDSRLSQPAVSTLTELVAHSLVLQKLVALGVSLREVEKCEGAADLVTSIPYEGGMSSKLILSNTFCLFLNIKTCPLV